MMHRVPLTKPTLLALCMCTGLSVSAAQTTLTLKQGVYVLTGTPCKDAPNAAILVWDGIGFSGAHSSHCTAQITHRQATRYQVDNACAAAGDGSASAPVTNSFTLSKLSGTRFDIARKRQASLRYRWCGANEPG